MSSISSIKCHLCNQGPRTTAWLERVNAKGQTGVWECRPSCDSKLSQEQAVLGALNSPDSKDKK